MWRHQTALVEVLNPQLGQGCRPQEAGLASGLVNTTGRVGGALGLAVSASPSSAQNGPPARGRPGTAFCPDAGYHIGFVIAALAALGLAVIATLALAPLTAALPATEEADKSLPRSGSGRPAPALD